MPPRSQVLDASVLTRLNLRARLLAEFPALLADDHALNDTLAGIDDLEEQIVAVLRLAVEREAMAGALGDLIADMTERKQRLLNGAKLMRGAALHAMQDAGLRTITDLKSPDMTITIGRGKPKLLILDEAAVPDDLCKIERTPKKKEIADWLSKLDTTEKPAWAEWGNPTPFLTIHRS